MTASTAFAMMWFVSVIGIGLFALSAIINLFRKQPRKEDWKKSLIFLFLSVVFLFLFAMTMEEEDISSVNRTIENTGHIEQGHHS